MLPHQPDRQRTPALVCGAWFFLFVLAPIVCLLGASQPGLLLHGAGRQTLLDALLLSLATSLCATMLCLLLGLPAGFLLGCCQFPGRAWLDAVVDLPLTLPPVVAGVALLMTYGSRGMIHRWFHVDPGLAFSTTAVILAQAFVASPFLVRAAQAGFGAVDPRLAQASATLGAGRLYTLRRIYLPLAAPALLSGATLTWARAMSEFGATLMFAGNLPGVTQTLPLAIMTAMDASLEMAVALSAVTVILAALFLLCSRIALQTRRQPQQQPSPGDHPA